MQASAIARCGGSKINLSHWDYFLGRDVLLDVAAKSAGTKTFLQWFRFFIGTLAAGAFFADLINGRVLRVVLQLALFGFERRHALDVRIVAGVE